MAKHRRTWNNSIFNKYLSEGRGQGFGAVYTPWLCIQDFPSLGMVSRVSGATTGRIHHLMSNLELSLFYLLDWSDDVIDIREQYLSVKPSSELGKPRVREKLEIERRYWSKRGVGWSVMTENEINGVKARSIEWLSQARDLSVFGLCGKTQDDCRKFFLDAYNAAYHSLGCLFRTIEKAFGLASGMGLNIYKHLVYWKHINFNAEEKVDVNKLCFCSHPHHAGGAA